MAICDQLDDYLCGWLDADASARFTEHLADCEACRSELELQQRINRNIVAYRESVAIPDSVVVLRVDPQRNPVSSRNRVSGHGVSGSPLAAVLVAAAVLLGIGIGLYLTGRSENRPADVAPPIVNDTPKTEPLVSVEPVQSPDADSAAAASTVTLEAGPGLIAVQVPSRSSRVSVFRVFNVIGHSSTRPRSAGASAQD